MAKRLALLAVGLGFALTLGACAIDPDAHNICTDGGPNSPGWPYCGSAQDPGGPGPADDPIDPTGRAPG